MDNQYQLSDYVVLLTNNPDSELHALRKTISEQTLEKQSLLKSIDDLKTNLQSKEARNIETEIALENQVKDLEKVIKGMHEASNLINLLTKPHNLKTGIGYPHNVPKTNPELYTHDEILGNCEFKSYDNEIVLDLEDKSRSQMVLKNKPLSPAD